MQNLTINLLCACTNCIWMSQHDDNKKKQKTDKCTAHV